MVSISTEQRTPQTQHQRWELMDKQQRVKLSIGTKTQQPPTSTRLDQL